MKKLILLCAIILIPGICSGITIKPSPKAIIITDGTRGVAVTDENAIVIEGTDAYFTQEGKTFAAGYTETLANNITTTLLLVTPASPKEIHGSFNITTSGKCQFAIYEAST